MHRVDAPTAVCLTARLTVFKQWLNLCIYARTVLSAVEKFSLIRDVALKF
jgi:hypothetical protein